MASDLHKRTLAWLTKAHSDLRTASILAADANPPYDTAVYHCQQAAEKALKAFVHHSGASIQKTHDVGRLVEIATALIPGFASLEADADLLTPLATSFRYPDESDWNAPLAPSAAEFQAALAAARRIYTFVLSTLPTDTHPV